MPSPRKVSPSPSLSACTSFLKERSIASSCAGYIYNGSKANATGGQRNRRLAAAIPAAYLVPVGTRVRRGHGKRPGGGRAFAVAATPADLRRHPWHSGDVRQHR